MSSLLSDTGKPTVEQKAFFARNGFLHISGFVPEEICDRLVDHTWTRFPAGWKRDDPETWTGDIADSCHTADLRKRRGFMQFQKGDLIGNSTVDRAFGAEAPGGVFAKGLIGRPLERMRVRGLYAIAPIPDSIEYKTDVRPHIESHAAQLVSLHYLQDVVPGGGGLLVWPGSHRVVYPAMGSKLEHVATPRFDEVFTQWAGLEPFEVPGKKGDVVIIHNRLLHAPSLNRSPNIRYAFLCDYQEENYRALCTQLPGEDIWEDWPEMKVLGAETLAAPCDYRLSSRTKAHDSKPMRMGPQGLSATYTTASDPSSVRKLDATVIARSRRDGDIWIALSDDPVTQNDKQLAPKGSDLVAKGIKIRVDGKDVSSVVRYDFMALIDVPDRPVKVEVSGLSGETWLRILKIRLPFENTEFVFRKMLGPGTHVLDVAFDEVSPPTH